MISSQLQTELCRILLTISNSTMPDGSTCVSSSNNSSLNSPELDSLEAPILAQHPFQHSLPLERFGVEYQLPHGVTLQKIHLEQSHYDNLLEQRQHVRNSLRLWCIFGNQFRIFFFFKIYPVYCDNTADLSISYTKILCKILTHKIYLETSLAAVCLIMISWIQRKFSIVLCIK